MAEPWEYLRAFRLMTKRTASTGHTTDDYDYDYGMSYIEGFISYMEGKCATPDCDKPVEWDVAAHQACGCQAIEEYCRTCASAQWYQSGLFGRRCATHSAVSQVEYHPRKKGHERCALCTASQVCPVWGRSEDL